MNRKLAEFLTSLYPRRWRQRYGEEFKVLLQDHSASFASVFNVFRGVLHQHLLFFSENNMTTIQRSIVLMGYGYLAAVAGGVNLYWTVDDTPLVDAMHSHTLLLGCWMLVTWASFLALAAVLAIAIPIVFATIRFALRARRRDLLIRLAIPPCIGGVVLLWIIGAALWNHSTWAPLPWAITGDWAAPASWPSLHVRWIEGCITLMLIGGGLIGSALSVKQTMRLSNFPLPHFLKIPTIILAGSIVLMAVGVAGWGLFSQQYASATFHARYGGLLGSSTFVSWMGSLSLFVAAAFAAVSGAKRAFLSDID